MQNAEKQAIAAVADRFSTAFETENSKKSRLSEIPLIGGIQRVE